MKIKLFYKSYCLIIGALLLLSLGGCFNDESDEADTSHNTGKNCLECHTAGGSGEGIFTAAGSVYMPDATTAFGGVTVNLLNGTTLVKTMVSDGNGNFHTGDSIDFGSGLTPSVVTSGGTRQMSSTIAEGGCNKTGCHDSNRRIVADQ
jgi:hypothetical protein